MIVKADIDPAAPQKITLTDVPFNMKDICEKVPGLRWDKKAGVNTWRMSKGWVNYLSLFSTFKTALEVGPDLAAWAEEEKTTRVDPCMYWREQEDAPGIEGLYPFQRVGVQFLKAAKRGLCADEMGLGKTAQAIATLMAHYVDGTDPFPALVVAPNNTKIGWKREFDRVWPGLTVVVVQGTITQRRKQLATPAHVYVMNWESIRSHSRLAAYGSTPFKKCRECGGNSDKVSATTCQVHTGELNQIEFKSVIVDEIHRMKEGSSQQTRAVKYATGDADIRIGLSGTPIANSPVDLWSILNWLSPEEWPSKVDYIDRMVDVSVDMYGFKKYLGIKSSMKDEFFAGFTPRMIRRTKAQVLPQLPPIVYERRDLDMLPKQKKAYEQMRDHMIAELDDSDNLVVTSPLVKIGRLSQFASSYAEAEVTMVMNDDGELKPETEVTLIEPSNKINALLDDLEDFGSSQIVVFAASRQLIELLSRRMDKHEIQYGLITGDVPMDERQHHMDRFQEGKLKYLLGTISAGGTGLTFTAADTLVYIQRSWSLIEDEQGDSRVHRIGSEIHDKITIIDYVSIDTVDEDKIESLDRKGTMAQEILRDKTYFKKFISRGKKTK